MKVGAACEVMTFPLARFTVTVPRPSNGAGPLSPTRWSTRKCPTWCCVTIETPLDVLACHVYATPSCNTPDGTVHVGPDWQPDSTTTPDLPSLPVATRKQYFTASPS